MVKRMWYVSARVVRNWHQSYQQKGKRACPASILSARLLFAAVSVQGVAGLHSFGETSARDVFDGEDYGCEDIAIVTNLSCPKCHSTVEVYLPKDTEQND